MESKLLDTPWKVDRDRRGQIRIVGKTFVIATGSDAEPIDLANFTAMAAAPELLEALEKAYTQIIVFLNEGHFGRRVEFDAGYIVDAITKARGGT